MDLHNKYTLNVNKYNINNNKYAIGLLAYPSINEPKWNYLFGACMISYRLKKCEWYKNNCDIILMTPVIEDNNILSLIEKIFDIHISYNNSLNTEFTFNTEPKWYGVFNKLYFWNRYYFDYKRLLIMDTDLFILKPDEYIKLLTKAEGLAAGCYEGGIINKIDNMDIDLKGMGTHIPLKFTFYMWEDNKSYYNMVNAGLLSIIPNLNLFYTMISDLEKGWDYISSKYPSLKNKQSNYFFPEQEYLTGFFSGQWKTLPSEFMSHLTTKYHYNNDGNIGVKYWDAFPSKDSEYGIVVLETNNFLNLYPESSIIFKNIKDKLGSEKVLENFSNINDKKINNDVIMFFIIIMIIILIILLIIKFY